MTSKRHLEKKKSKDRVSYKGSEGGGGPQSGISQKLDPILAEKERKGDYQMNC